MIGIFTVIILGAVVVSVVLSMIYSSPTASIITK